MTSRMGLAEGAALLGVLALALTVPVTPATAAIAGIDMDAVIVTTVLAIALWLPLMARRGIRGIPRVGFEIPALVFLGWSLISMVFTGAEVGVLATWTRYAAYVLLVYAVATVTARPAGQRLVLWAITLSGSVTVAQGLAQYTRPAAMIGMQGLDPTVATRVFSTFDNPNFYAEFLVLLFAVTLALVFIERGPLRYVAAGLLAAESMALLLTYTRGSWLALAVGLLVAVLMIDTRLLLPFVLGGAALIPVVPGALARVLSIFSLEGTATYRMSLWRVAGSAIRDQPAFGYGMGRWYDAFATTALKHPELGVNVAYYGAHQSYFQLTAEVGVIGGIAFAVMVFAACRMGAFYGPRMGGDLRSRLVNASLTAGMIAFALNALTSNAFQHPRGAVFFFVLAGIQAGLGSTYWEREPVARDRREKVPGVWANSVPARAYAAVEVGVGAAWSTSVTRRVLAGMPPGGGMLLASSRTGRSLFGR
ncbi:MAG: O-antigen ligase family protein [Coriobacteriia bacterium]